MTGAKISLVEIEREVSLEPYALLVVEKVPTEITLSEWKEGGITTKSNGRQIGGFL